MRAVPITGEAPGLRERKKARLRRQISETALRLFRKSGYRATTIERITDELEISPATFYNYFGSKDAVLGEVGRIALEHSRSVLEEELASSATRVDMLRKFLRRISEGIEADKNVWRAIFATGALNRTYADGERTDGTELAGRRREEVARLALLEEIIRGGQERGEFSRALGADALAQILSGVILKLAADFVFDFPTAHRLTERMEAALALFTSGMERAPARIPDIEEPLT